MAKLEIDVTADVADAVKQLGLVNAKIDGMAAAAKPTGISLTELKSGLGLVQEGARYVQQAIDATIGVTVEYAKQVRDLSREIGASSEQTSMLIQAADDVGISFGTLESAMTAAIRKGIRPSIEGLGELSDKYLEIKDPIERTKFLMDNLGRSGADLAPLMEKGSKGIKELGEGARATGQVLSGEAVQAARDYEIALDSMGDAVTGVQYQLGNLLMPAAIGAANTIGKAAQAYNDFLKIEQLLAIKIQLATGMMDQQTASVKAAAVAGVDLNTTVEKIPTAMELATDATVNAAMQTAILTRDYELAAPVLHNFTESIYEKVEAERNATASSLMQQQNAIDQKNALELLNQSMENYRAGLSGEIGTAQENYRAKMAEGAAESVKLQSEIDKLNAKPYLTAEQTAQLDGLKTKLAENNLAVIANADEHDKATKRILLGYLEQNLAASGGEITQKEIDDLTKVQKAWGLVDDATLVAMKTVQDAAAAYASNGDVTLLYEIPGKAAENLETMKNKASEGYTAVNQGLNTVVTNPDVSLFDQQMQEAQENFTGIATEAATIAPAAATMLADTSPSIWQMVEEAEKASKAVGAIGWEMKNIPDKKTITITTIYKEIREAAGLGGVDSGPTAYQAAMSIP